MRIGRALEPNLPLERDPVVAAEQVERTWRDLRLAILGTGDRQVMLAAALYAAAVRNLEDLRPSLLDRAAAWQRIPRSDHERIRDRRRQGARVSELAAEYRVTPSRIHQICAEGG